VLDGYIYVTGGYGHRNEAGSAEFVNRAYRFSPAENQWERLPDMPIARCFHACAAAEGRIWLFGGLSQAGTTDSVIQVDCYDPVTRKWTTPTNLPTPRNRLAAGTVGGKIYVIGGLVHHDSADVEILDASTGKWSEGPALPIPRHGHAVVELPGALAVIAGSGTGEATITLEGSAWRERAKLPRQHLFSSAATIGPHIYLAGNRVPEEIPLLRYDIAADKWEVAGKSPQVCRAAAAALGEKLYVMCGEDPEGAELSRVSVFDPASGVWMHSQ
jgi:non-specific serine/threonine protein kinase